MAGRNLDEERKEFNQDSDVKVGAKDDFFDDYSNSDINKKETRDTY